MLTFLLTLFKKCSTMVVGGWAVAVLPIILFSSYAFAQNSNTSIFTAYNPVQELSAVIQIEIDPEIIDGKPVATELMLRNFAGIWFPMASTRDMLEKIKQLALCEAKEANYIKLAEVNAKRSILLETNAEAANKVAALWQTTAEAQNALVEPNESFWKAPILWAVVGFVAGTATTIAVLFAVKESK